MNSNEVYFKKMGCGFGWHARSKKTHEPMHLVNNGVKKMYVPIAHEKHKKDEDEEGSGLFTPGSGIVTPGSGMHSAPSESKRKAVRQALSAALNKGMKIKH
jgi:hypothetical protein